jgi:hypothetical protein
MFGSGNRAVSQTATQYEGPPAIGNIGWDGTEADVSIRLPGGTLKNLYIDLATAPGGGAKNRAFTVRSNNADTALVATAVSTRDASDTTHTVTHVEGNTSSVKMVPTNSPVASAGAKFGYVLVIPQPSNSAGAFFGIF